MYLTLYFVDEFIGCLRNCTSRIIALFLRRKRTGGIQLEEGEEEESETPKAEVDTDNCDSYNKQLAEQIGKEKELKKEEDQKKKADSLWADFMSDVGSLKPKPKPSSGGLASLSSLSKVSLRYLLSVSLYYNEERQNSIVFAW